jgi:hypothetical protein
MAGVALTNGFYASLLHRLTWKLLLLCHQWLEDVWRSLHKVKGLGCAPVAEAPSVFLLTGIENSLIPPRH